MQTDLEPDAAVQAAAEWLAAHDDHSGRAIVPETKQRFGITALQVIEAIRLANIIRNGRAR
jgi:hypothetical protein